jgi:branched-chain amino acid transport system permease protein
VIVRTRDGVEVPGLAVRVGRDGARVTTGTTGPDGTVTLRVPGTGDYLVTLDVADLQEPVAGLVPRLNPIRTTVNEGSPRTVAFRLEPAEHTPATSDTGLTSTNRVLQLGVQGVRFGLLIALAAIGLSLVFGTTGLTNFAHGELITFGALSAYFLNIPFTLSLVGLPALAKPRIPLLGAAVVALLLCGLFGWANDRLLWSRLRRRGTGLVAMMIVSIGLALFLRYLFLFFAGGSTLSYADFATQAGIELGPVLLRPVDLVSMALAVTVLVAVGLALLRTRWGTATRAVADNPALAAASGIDVDQVIRMVWVGAAVLAGLAGILLGVGQGLNFQMGFQVLLLVFAAVTLGGLGTAFGALVGSLVVGLLIELSTLVVPTELKNVGALAVLIVILLVRPQGILGRAERVG